MPSNILIKTGSLLASVFVAGGLAFAQPPGPQNLQPRATTGHMMSKMSDQAFVKKTSEASQAQVKFGRLAQQKGSTEAVKNYGKQMAQHHQRFEQRLQSAASQANLDLPQGKMSSLEQHGYSRLSKLSGADFDRAFAQDVLKGDQAAVAAFREEAQNGKKQPIKNFARNELPVLQSHLNKARDLSNDVQSANAQAENGNSSSRRGSR